MRTVVYNLFSLPSPSYPVNNSVCPRAASLRAIRAQGIVFHAFPREEERYIFYLIGIHMEHMAKNRERRSASSEMFSGQARTRGQGVNELVELIGLPAAIELIRAKGGTSFSVPLGITLRGQEQREKLVQIIGREQATKLIGRYGGTTLYIPTCRQAFLDTRDRNINLERDELAREGLSERALVSVLAVRHGLSDRQIWRILKKSGPVRPDMAACAAARRVSRSSARC